METCHHQLLTFAFLFGRFEKIFKSTIMLICKYFRHDYFDIPLEQLLSVITQVLHNKVVSMNNTACFWFISRNGNIGCFGVKIVFWVEVISFVDVSGVFQQLLGLFKLSYMSRIFVCDVHQKMSINYIQLNAMLVELIHKLISLFGFHLRICNLSSCFFQHPDIWVLI